VADQSVLRLLNIEDNPADADLLVEILAMQEKGTRFELIHEALLETGLARLAAETFHALFLDLNLPDSQGLETIGRVRQVAPNLPILVMTGVNDDDLALRAMQAGAQDYLVKGQMNPDLLERAVRYAVERKRIDTAQQRRAHELQALYRTSLEINAEMDLATVLSSIVTRAALLLEMPMGGLYLMEPDGEHLRLVVGYKVMEKYIGTVLSLGEGLSGRAAQTRQAMFVEDYQNWDGFALAYDRGPFRRVLAIPMQVGGRVTGVINLSDDQKAGPFSEEEVRLASLFADQAAIVVEKTRLLEAERIKGLELERSNKLIAALSEVVSGLQTTHDTHQVMQTVGVELNKLGVFLQIAELDEESVSLKTRFTSLDLPSLAYAEEQAGFQLLGLHVGDRVNHPREMMETRHPLFLPRILPMFSSALLECPLEVLTQLLASVGISAQTCGIHLPMVVKDRPFGALLVWGADLRENDVPAFNVFANQVAAALENARLYNEIQKLAIMDELTGLYNRRGFFALAQQHIHLAQRVQKTVLLVFADIDGMKEINDSLGHSMGDQALIDAANVLRQTYRMADIIARVGGDEFAVLAVVSALPDTGSLNNRLVEQLENFNTEHERPYVLSLSIGKSIWSSDKTAVLDSMLSEADARMYIEKRTKKKPPGLNFLSN
jgi:diguanylate cyclase (GGDEF)-like protein